MSAGNVSNFKGVMLCNRPPETSPALYQSSADQGGYGGGRNPFVSTVLPPDQLGLNPIKKDFPAVAKKDETEDVTWRAKRWLAEFQERQTDLCDMLEQAAIEKEEKQRRFREKQAKMRATIRDVKDMDPNNREAMAAALEMEGDAPAEVVKTVKMKKKASKPKWAMTAEQNEDAELDEVDDLLNFTENLDFDQYIGDMEVKEALNFVKTRVENLQNGDARDPEEEEEYEGDELESEEEDEFATLADMEGQKEMKKRARRARKRRDEDGASVYSEGAESVMSTTSTVSRAHALLSNNTKMKAVHSQASVTAMMEREKKQYAMQGGGGYAVQPPIVATTKDRDSADFDPANLPYLNRSPQV